MNLKVGANFMTKLAGHIKTGKSAVVSKPLNLFSATELKGLKYIPELRNIY